LRTKLGGSPCRREAPVAERAGEDAEPIARLSRGTADEAARERVLVESRVTRVRSLGLLETRRGGEVELERRRDGFGDESVSVEDPDAAAFALDGERLRERR